MERSNKERILRLADVKTRTGKSRSAIYLEMNQGTFPKHISLGVRTVGHAVLPKGRLFSAPAAGIPSFASECPG